MGDDDAAALYSDNCGGTVSATHTDAVTGDDCSWTVTRTYTIKDVCNNETTATMSVSGSDQTYPTISSTITEVNATGSGCDYRIPDFISDLTSYTVHDNCSDDSFLLGTITQSPAAGTEALMSQDVTITITDGCGLQASTTIHVDVPTTVQTQATPPVICLTESTSITVISGGSSTLFSYVWSDGDNVWETLDTPDDTNTIIVTPTGTTTYGVTVTDASGCVQATEITVTVKPLPVVTFTDLGNVCPNVGTQEIVANIEATTPGYTYEWTSNLSLDGTDNGTQNETAFTIGVVVPNDYNNTNNCNRTNWIRLHVTDNDALHCEYEETYTIVIKDEDVPHLIDPSSTFPAGEDNLNLCASQKPGPISDDVIRALYSDNCSEVLVSHITTEDSGDNCSWTITYQYTIEDKCGNGFTEDLTYTGGDTERPTIVCPSDYNVNADFDHPYATLTIPVPTTADNCEVVSVVNDFNNTDDASGHYNIGTTTVTYTVTDGCANVNEPCSFTVTVSDNTPPCIGCDPDNPDNPDPNGVSCITIAGTTSGSTVERETSSRARDEQPPELLRARQRRRGRRRLGRDLPRQLDCSPRHTGYTDHP